MATSRAKKPAKKTAKKAVKKSARKAAKKSARKAAKKSAKKSAKKAAPSKKRSASARGQHQSSRKAANSRSRTQNNERRYNDEYVQQGNGRSYADRREEEDFSEINHRNLWENMPPQRGYVSSNVAHYMVEPNSTNSRGGRSYGQGMAPRNRYDNGNGRNPENGEYGIHNGQQDWQSAGRSRGDSFAQTNGQHRRGNSGYFEDDRRRDGYNGRDERMHDYPEEPRFRRDEQYGSNDRRFRDQDRNGRDDHEREHTRNNEYTFNRWEDNNARENDWLEDERHAPGYHASAERQGFGFRKSRRHQGGWLGEEEYRGGHAMSRRGNGKHGSR